MRADLDRAIDRAVGEMLDVEPPPDLRAQVLERIAHPHTRRLPWVIVPLAAAALLVLVLAGPWRASQKTSPFLRASSLAQSVAAIRTPLTRGVNRTAIEPARTASNAARVRPLVRLPPAAPAMQVRVPALDPLDAIDVPPVSVTRLDDRQVAVAPLAPIEQIQIEPVGPPEGRN
jgi:hypothetical protein